MDFGMDLDMEKFFEKSLPAWTKFVDAYSSVNNMESLGRVEIKNVFKLANDLEVLLSENEEYSCILAAKLKQTGKMSLEPTVEAGRKASDAILTKFLMSQSKKPNCKEWAVDEYVNVCGKDRLKSLIESLLLVEMSKKVVLEYVKQKAMADPSGKFASELGLRIVATELKKLKQCGDVEGISTVVSILLNDQANPGKVLDLLLLRDDSRTWDEVKPMILETVLESVDVGSTSGSFLSWQVLAASVDGRVIAGVCRDFPLFLGALLKAVVRGGSRLQCKYCQQTKSYRWVAPEDGAHTLQFEHLVGLVRSLLASRGAVAEQTLVSLEATRAETGGAVWDEILAAATV